MGKGNLPSRGKLERRERSKRLMADAHLQHSFARTDIRKSERSTDGKVDPLVANLGKGISKMGVSRR